jgi:hypothetical protein
MKTALPGSMDQPQHSTNDYKQFGKLLINQKLESEMMSALPTKLWYQTLAVMQEDAPELMDQFIEESAAKMEVTVDYLMKEFL